MDFINVIINLLQVILTDYGIWAFVACIAFGFVLYLFKRDRDESRESNRFIRDRLEKQDKTIEEYRTVIDAVSDELFAVKSELIAVQHAQEDDRVRLREATDALEEALNRENTQKLENIQLTNDISRLKADIVKIKEQSEADQKKLRSEIDKWKARHDKVLIQLGSSVAQVTEDVDTLKKNKLDSNEVTSVTHEPNET